VVLCTTTGSGGSRTSRHFALDADGSAARAPRVGGVILRRGGTRHAAVRQPPWGGEPAAEFPSLDARGSDGLGFMDNARLGAATS
jgi:hypothetical protein